MERNDQIVLSLAAAPIALAVGLVVVPAIFPNISYDAAWWIFYGCIGAATFLVLIALRAIFWLGRAGGDPLISEIDSTLKEVAIALTQDESSQRNVVPRLRETLSEMHRRYRIEIPHMLPSAPSHRQLLAGARYIREVADALRHQRRREARAQAEDIVPRIDGFVRGVYDDMGPH